jgi:N-acetylmuramoyl-L-alanine amidase
MVVSEIKSSRLNLKVNGMSEGNLSKLKNASGPALQIDFNLMNTAEDKVILTNDEKLTALAKTIYECIERISKSE